MTIYLYYSMPKERSETFRQTASQERVASASNTFVSPGAYFLLQLFSAALWINALLSPQTTDRSRFFNDSRLFILIISAVSTMIRCSAPASIPALIPAPIAKPIAASASDQSPTPPVAPVASNGGAVVKQNVPSAEDYLFATPGGAEWIEQIEQTGAPQ
jgi:hypothetical protein